MHIKNHKKNFKFAYAKLFHFMVNNFVVMKKYLKKHIYKNQLKVNMFQKFTKL